jgi:hypothetical protein
MSDRSYRPPDDDPADFDATQRTSSPTERMSIPPPPSGRGHVRMANDRYGTGEAPRPRTDDYTVPAPAAAEPPPGAAVRRARRRVQRKSDSGLFLPAWSVLAMLVIVLAVAGVLIFVVVSLGGTTPAAGDPRVMIITAVPSETPLAQALPDELPTLPVSALAQQSSSGTPGALPTFALEGPVLPTVVLTQAPARIEVGRRVVVINVGASRLNVRESPGTAASILFQANVGDTFDIIGGPETTTSSGNTLTWWQLRSVSNPGQSGWAVDNDGEQDVLEVAQP